MSFSLIMYGATYCGDTIRTRRQLNQLGINFEDVNIDHDEEAERFVIFINKGYRSTPTLVFGDGKFKNIAVEPSNMELLDILKQVGYSLAETG